MIGVTVVVLVVVLFLLIYNHHVSWLASSSVQCVNCGTKPSGTYYKSVSGCATASCVSCPTVTNGTNTLTTACSDATAALPLGYPGTCTLTCNPGYSKSTSGTLCVADCVGTWGACVGTCDSGTYTYKVNTPAEVGGKACADPDGTPRKEGDTKPCVLPACAAPCIGTWSGWGTCSAPCGYATRSNTFTATQAAQSGGSSCEAIYGPSAHYPTSTISEPCLNQPVCTSGTDCSGSWSGWGTCSAPCGGGEQINTYNATGPTTGTDGTTGKACKDTDGVTVLRNGDTKKQPCNTQDCCTTAQFSAWQKLGTASCSGKASGKPEQDWGRNITWPATTPGSVTPASCSFNQFYTKFSADGCSDVTPIKGTCSSIYGTWSATNGCTMPATKTPNGGTCTITGVSWNSTTGCALAATKVPNAGTCSGTQATWSSATGCTQPANLPFLTPSSITCPNGGTWKQLNTMAPFACFENNVYKSNKPALGCPDTYVANFASYQGRAMCAATTAALTDLTCDPGYTKDLSNNRCVAQTSTISTLACPVDYTGDVNNNTCTATGTSITGLTCDTPYWKENRPINKCSSTNYGSSAPCNTATGDCPA